MSYERWRISYFSGERGSKILRPELMITWIWRGREYAIWIEFGLQRPGFERRTDPHGKDLWNLGVCQIAVGGGMPAAVGPPPDYHLPTKPQE